MKLYVMMAMVFSIAACNGTADNQVDTDTTKHVNHDDKTATGTGPSHMKEMHDAMTTMEEQMKATPPSGDPDYDFTMMMKHHHEGAISMGKAELAGGTDGTIKRIAQKIIDAQQQDLPEFDRILSKDKPSGKSDYAQKAMGMMTPMSNIQMESGSLDAMFASMMIPHHEDGIKMAQEYLKSGRDDDMKRIANKIISTHPREISELRDWLDRNKR
ncbi:MAG TPA: DUF305 domain-containing protein [Flavisolibacter sp.]